MGIKSQGKVEAIRGVFDRLGLSAPRSEVINVLYKEQQMSVGPQWVERIRGVMKAEQHLGTPAANGTHKGPPSSEPSEEAREWARKQIEKSAAGKEEPKTAERVTAPPQSPVENVLTAKEEVATVSLVQIVLDVQQLISVMGSKEHLKLLIDVL